MNTRIVYRHDVFIKNVKNKAFHDLRIVGFQNKGNGFGRLVDCSIV